MNIKFNYPSKIYKGSELVDIGIEISGMENPIKISYYFTQ